MASKNERPRGPQPSPSSRERNPPDTPACTPSRYRFSCGVCAADIAPGDLMFPFVAAENRGAPVPGVGVGDHEEASEADGLSSTTGDGRSGEVPGKTAARTPALMWAHRRCATLFGPGGVPPPPACRHWSRLGRCPVLDAGLCAFGHGEADRGAGIDIPGLARRRRMGGKRAVVRNGHKNSAFRIFLMRTYGVDYLRSGVILEVAGGKGELAWEMVNLVGAEVMNVDPRPMSLGNAESRWRNGMYEPRRTGPVFRRWLPAVEDGSSKSRYPRKPIHLKCFFRAESFVRLAKHKPDDDPCGFDAQQWLRTERENAKKISWTTRGLKGLEKGENAVDCDGKGVSRVASFEDFGYEDDCIVDVNEALSLLKLINLVLGLHPDQGAGDIADFAERMDVPWCIVPCCVYSEMFSKRRLRNGSRVTTHGHLMQWLKEKNPGARIDTLDFAGKNQVVYTIPRSQRIS